MSRDFFTTKKPRGDQVNITLTPRLAEMLEQIVAETGIAKADLFRNAILEKYEWILGLSRAGSTQGGSGDPGEEGTGAVRRGPVPPKVSGRSGKADQPQKRDPGLQKTG
jgi:hypothetical protein